MGFSEWYPCHIVCNAVALYVPEKNVHLYATNHPIERLQSPLEDEGFPLLILPQLSSLDIARATARLDRGLRDGYLERSAFPPFQNAKACYDSAMLDGMVLRRMRYKSICC